jgi:hypothetical protein
MGPRQPYERQLDQNASSPRPVSCLGRDDRRAFLRALGGAGLAASCVLRSSAVLLGPGAALLQSDGAYAVGASH